MILPLKWYFWNKILKIIYLHQYFTTPDMSGGTRSYEMARRLVEWGHEVHIVTSWRRPTSCSDWFDEVIEGINVHWLPVPYDNSMSFWQRMRAFFRFAGKAGQRAVHIGGDVVFATSTPLTIALPGVYAASRLKVPMVFEVRDLWPEVPIAMGYLKNPLLRWTALRLERFAYDHACAVIALSDGMADGVVAAGFPRERVHIIPNSSDLELFAHDAAGAVRFRGAHPEIGDRPIALYPGALGVVNDVSYLARLAHPLRELLPEACVVVIGAGAEEDKVRSVAARLGILGKNFFQYEAVPKRDLVDAFSAAAVIVSCAIDKPALRANSANKFFDALASGTPVAVNYGGWQAELITETGAGLAMSPDPDAAAPALAALLGDERRLALSGARARELAETRYSREDLARKLERVLLASVEGKC